MNDERKVVAFRVSAQALQDVANYLATQPYKDVAPLINAIQQSEAEYEEQAHPATVE